MKIAVIMVAAAQAKELAIVWYSKHDECAGPWSAYSVEEGKCDLSAWPPQKATCAEGLQKYTDENCTLASGLPLAPGVCSLYSDRGSYKLAGCEDNAGWAVGGGMVQVAALVGVGALLLQ